MGNAWVRITLVDAIPEKANLDFGAPPAATPQTDFNPVYQVDSLIDNDRGVYVYGTVIANLNHVFDYRVYGEII
ncbi:MAG: hypothetical protein IT292_06805 [Deltaproteobacteria bacterium]|nr:hypothetical protein [Deltaproteobacteria bacterium]